MVKRKILITGSNGQLGRALVRFYSPSCDVVGVGVKDCDIQDYSAVRSCLRSVQPHVVMHTAAYTDVDGCEANEERAMLVNASGTENVARVCGEVSAKMIYYSTDYVFDGHKRFPYTETDVPNPQTMYGKSKLEGERRMQSVLDNCIILRVAWMYGIDGKNFLKTIVNAGCRQLEQRKQGRRSEPLKVVDDQIGSPTWTDDVARQTEVVIENDLTGLFHATSEGETSRYRLACDIFDLLSLDVIVEPCRSDEYPSGAPRPKYSSLENCKLKETGLNVMRDYLTALREFIERYGEELPTWSAK